MQNGGELRMEKATRMTKQKKIILDVLRSTKSHPTADWIYEQARKELPDISLGTVYRNLNLLRDMGEIMELNYGSTFSRFDGNPHNHYHFACKGCERVFDIEIPLANEMERNVEVISGFEVDFHRIEFYGSCDECKTKNTATKN
jgi:Fur family transcriptional regulator, peroxide stress response regulator